MVGRVHGAVLIIMAVVMTRRTLMRFLTSFLVACNLDSSIGVPSPDTAPDSPPVGPAWGQTAYVKASNTDADDRFGSSVAIAGDGQRIAVTSCGESSALHGINQDGSNNGALNSGAAYILRREGNTWIHEAYLKASNADAGDSFGCANGTGKGGTIAISSDGTTVAVGAQREQGASRVINTGEGDNSASGAGAVYVFVREGTIWRQEAYLKSTNLDAGDRFGNAVALSSDGNRLAVGAFGEKSNSTMIEMGASDNSASTAGAAYIFDRVGGTWSQKQYIKAPNTEAFDAFGSLALSADGSMLAVGAFLEDSNTTVVDGDLSNNLATDSGAVYVYKFGFPLWTLDGYIKAPNAEAGDLFGLQVAMSGDGATLVVGASSESGVVGDPASNAVAASGASYVYVRDGNGWKFESYLKAPNPGPNDGFSELIAISIDGSRIAVGASNEDSGATGIDGNQLDNTKTDSGAVYVFDRDGTSWGTPTFIKTSNSDAGDGFCTVALNVDGTVLVGGAPGEASDARDVGGDQGDNSLSNAGAAYVFELKPVSGS